jgi:transcriptional regulator with XRE-family HTH domain
MTNFNTLCGPHAPHDPEDLARYVAVVIGRTIRCLRARRGLSQEELGFRAGLHRNFVGHVERGEGNPTTRVLVRLAVGLGMPLEDLAAEFRRALAETAF